MTDIVKRLRDLDTATCEDAADEIERLRAQVRKSALDCLAADGQAADLMGEVSKLRAALRDMAQEDATNARRMRTAIVLARKKLDISRPMWTGPILQADGILAQALTVNNDSAALEERT